MNILSPCRRNERMRTIKGYLAATFAFPAIFCTTLCAAQDPTLNLVQTVFDDVGGVNGLDSVRAVDFSPDGAHLYAVGNFDDALSAFSINAETGSLTFIEAVVDGVDGVDGLDGAVDLAVTPDGTHIYVVSDGENAVSAFARNPSTGEISFVQALFDDVDGVDGLAGATQVAVSPDGAHVYVTGAEDDAISVFSRDLASGTLSFVEALFDAGSAAQLDDAAGVAVSPDGAQLYVIASSHATPFISVFARDRVSGRLDFTEAEPLNRGSRHVVVSPDGKHVYAGSFPGFHVFERDSETGSLALLEKITLRNGFTSPNGMSMSSDGTSMYSVYFDDEYTRKNEFFYAKIVSVHSRDPVTGTLSLVESINHGEGGERELGTSIRLGVAPNTGYVYVPVPETDTTVTFSHEAGTGAFSLIDQTFDGQGGPHGFVGPDSIAVAPGGNHVYVAGTLDRSIAIFARDAGTGHLAFVEPPVSISGSLLTLAISPDGADVYAAIQEEHFASIVQFNRDPATGLLTSVGSFTQDVGYSLENPSRVIVSPDGQSVYISSRGSTVWVASRDLSTGTLSFVEGHSEYGILDGVNGLAVSPDGNWLYAAAQDANALVVFSRDQSTGLLTLIESAVDGLEGVDGLAGATDVAVSPDGANVYVASKIDDAVAVFGVDEDTGLPVFVEAHFDGACDVTGLGGANSVIVSGDGEFVYVASGIGAASADAIAVFARNPNTGQLTFVEARFDNEEGIDGLDGARGLAVAPGAPHLYVAGFDDNSVTVFEQGAVEIEGRGEEPCDPQDGSPEGEGEGATPEGDGEGTAPEGDGEGIPPEGEGEGIDIVVCAGSPPNSGSIPLPEPGDLAPLLLTAAILTARRRIPYSPRADH